MVTGTHSASYAWYVDNPFDMNSYTFLDMKTFNYHLSNNYHRVISLPKRQLSTRLEFLT